MNLLSPKDWDKAWQRTREDTPWRTHRERREVLNHWERKAPTYSKNVMRNRGGRRIHRVFSFLEREGLDLEGMRILDIGAGPGAYTLPLAQKAKEVVALEPVETMVKNLQEEIEREGIENTRVIQETWEDVDLKRKGFEGAFELVFASRTPGINNRETVEKALLAGRDYCFFSSFAGPRKQYEDLNHLYPLLFQEEPPPWPGDFFFLYNLLYSMDLTLSSRVYEEEREEILEREEAVETLLTLVEKIEREKKIQERVLEKEKEKEKIVEDYVEKRIDSNYFTMRFKTRVGMVLVKVPSLSSYS